MKINAYYGSVTLDKPGHPGKKQRELNESDFRWLKQEHDTGFRYQLQLKKPVTGSILRIRFKLVEVPNLPVLINGYQSWTDSSWRPEVSSVGRLRWPISRLLYPYGDYRFFSRGSRLKKRLYSNVFVAGELSPPEKQSNDIWLFGSMNEEQGFTRWYLVREGLSIKIVLEKDIEGREHKEGEDIIDFITLSGPEKKVFEYWYKEAGYKKKQVPATTGFTSWYNFYTDINEKQLTGVLNAYDKTGAAIDYFQIDDGYQTAVGDWLSINEDFNGDMKPIADKIHESGKQAGLWLAPFIIEKNSKIYKEHPEWVKKYANGKPVRAGYNPLWSGPFYALDIDNTKVQDYLEQVFKTVFDKYRFDLVKLDFLYAACIVPAANKTRAETMRYAMQLLRKWCGKGKILACGVPLNSAFGLVEYSRIGADLGLSWETRWLRHLQFRERISTKSTLGSTITRSVLDNLAFGNDPDVILLRDEKRSGKNGNISLSKSERFTVLVTNHLFGSLVFSSDHPDYYDDETKRLYLRCFPHLTKENIQFLSHGDFTAVTFEKNKIRYLVAVNLGAKGETLTLPEGVYYDSFENDMFLSDGTLRITVDGHETRVWVVSDPDKDIFAGSDLHIFPGFEFDKLSLKRNRLELKHNPANVLEGEVLLHAGRLKELKYGKKNLVPQQRNGIDVFVIKNQNR